MRRYFFRKSQRLKTNKQYRAVLANKCGVRGHLFRLYIRENSCGWPRLGVSVNRSWGGSVARNRLKRLTREVFRREQHNIGTNFDYLLIFLHKMSKKSKSVKRPVAGRVTFEEIRKSFLELAAKGAGRLHD